MQKSDAASYIEWKSHIMAISRDSTFIQDATKDISAKGGPAARPGGNMKEGKLGLRANDTCPTYGCAASSA